MRATISFPLICLLLLFGALPATGDERGPTPMTLPESLAVTDDGDLILSWRGDLWLNDDATGARRLTFHPAEDRRPYVSPDGKSLAFTSNRTGTEQVYVMPIQGGVPRRITQHSEGARAYGWFPDGKSLLVRSRRDHHWRRSDRLFRKPLDIDAAPELLFDSECGWGAISSDGTKIAFTRGGRPWWRKGYRGPAHSQLWLYDLEDKAFAKLTSGEHNELWPLWGRTADELLYVSDEDGTHNLWSRNVSTGKKKQLTTVREDGVNYPAVSPNGEHVAFRRLEHVYRFSFEVSLGPTPRTPVYAGDSTIDPTRRSTLRRASAVAFADDAREIAFIAGGDLWVMDTELKEPRRITNTPEEERDPVFSPDFQAIYFVSDATGKTDVWQASRSDAKKHWWQNDTFKVKRLTNDAAVESSLRITPDGKHLAFVKGNGDVHMMTTDGKDPRRVVSSFAAPPFTFSPDSRWIAYSKPDDFFNWDIWIQPIDGSQEPVNVSVHPDNDFNPAWSPDGKVLAFTGRRWTEETDICFVWLRKEDDETEKRDRTLEKALKKMEGRKKDKKKKKGKKDKEEEKPSGKADPATKDEPAQKATHDPFAGVWKGTLQGGDPLPEDGVDLTVEIKKADDGYAGTVGVAGQFSGPIESLTYSKDTGAFAFAFTSPLGPLAGEGTVSGNTMQGTWEIEGTMEGTFEASRAEAAPTKAGGDDKPKEKEEEEETKPVEVDLEDIADRVKRVSIADASESGLMWSPDSKKLAFRASIKGARGLYTVEFPEPKEPKLLTKVNGSGGRWLKTGNQIAWLVGGVPATLSANGKATSHGFSIRHEVHLPALHAAAFDKAWRTMRDRFYDANLNGRDWDAVREKYQDMAAAALTPLELQTVVNYMLGELNGSHLGFRASGAGWRNPGWRDVTGHLGVRWDPDFEGPGLRVGAVIDGAPAHEERHRIHPREIVLSIDGLPVGPETHIDRLLTGDPARHVDVRVQDTEGEVRTLRMQPTSYPAVRRRLYDHWIEANRAKVDELSKGRLGYLHVRGMNWSSFLRFEAELYKVGHGKDALLIDVRDNGGGFTTDHLLTCLTQPRHAITVPRGGGPGYPQDRMVYAPWHKPVVVLCNQNSFSNAEIFAHAIKNLGRGPIVGVQTAGGVISTGGTNVMGLGSLRLPFRGWYLASTGADMELGGCMPDHVIWPRPEDHATGHDRQLEKAVEVGLAEINAYAKRPQPKLVPRSQR